MLVRYTLLGLLAQRAHYGHELQAALEAGVGGEQDWNLKATQIYMTLARLAEGGLIKQESGDLGTGPEKRIYALTQAGRIVLQTWFNTGVVLEYHRDEFFIKLMLCLRIPDVQPRTVVQAQRRRLFQDLHAATTQRNHTNPKVALARMFLLDKAIMHLEADLRWLDLVETRLEEMKKQAWP